ncbi:MAG TPA: pyridoxamine 5'-phosphate oxidase family protein [Thermoanaerobaculia bacterium]|nr:pyridoxamine 5'-phosphate oxidase family protein [Thermoanaerobaculia bacterium]
MESEYITSLDELRARYAEPGERALRKQLAQLDQHCRRFISLSPFVVIGTAGREHALDASPRGGDPGFVKVVDDQTLWIPDAPGNNRLDSLANIVATGRVGLLFLIPGVDETLRVNGAARLSTSAEKRAAMASAKRVPSLLIEVTVEEAFLHCAKALMRSGLWSAEARQARTVLPTLGAMLADQTGLTGVAETQEQMVARYQKDL